MREPRWRKTVQLVKVLSQGSEFRPPELMEKNDAREVVMGIPGTYS